MPAQSEENKQVIRHLYDALGRGDTDSTSPGADVKASKVTRTHSPRLRVAVIPDTAAREKAVMTRLMLAALSGLISPFAGGWLTDDYSWRWVFYINIPVGIAAILMCLRFLEDPPYLKNAPAGKFDSFGIGFLALWIGCLQVMLDKGQDDDWFSSNFIRWLAVLAVIGFILFLVRELTTPKSDREFERVEESKSCDRGCLELQRWRDPLRHNGCNANVSATFAWISLFAGRPRDEPKRDRSNCR